jgi:hypothetical protein
VGDYLGSHALSPQAHLVDGGSAESVCGGHHHPAAVGMIGVGQLGDGGGLAAAVDAHHQDDGRSRGRLAVAVTPEPTPRLAGSQDGDQLFLEGSPHGGWLPEALRRHALSQTVQHLLRGGDAGVGADEELLQLQPQLLVEGRAVEEAGDAAEPGAAGALEGFGRELSRTGLFGLLLGLRGAAKETYQGRYSLIVLAGHRTSAPEEGSRKRTRWKAEVAGRRST